MEDNVPYYMLAASDTEKTENYKIVIKRGGVLLFDSNVFTVTWTNDLPTYTVYYGVGEGQGSGVADYGIEYGTNYTLDSYKTIGAVAPAGQEFDYWSIRVGNAMSAEIAQKQAGDEITINADTFIIAMWKNAPTVTVSYYSVGNVIDSDTVAVGTQHTLMNTQGLEVPSGKKFKAWAIGGLGGEQKQPGVEITITEETYIYAVWEDITYTVSFNANGGTGSMLDETEQLGGYVLPECDFTAPTGKKFKCWAEGSASGTQYAPNEEYDVTGDVTFYAVWENISHTCGNGVLQSGQAATCTVNGWKDYYKCSCGKYYEDANCTKLISDLEAWKVGEGKIVAEHTYGDLIPEDPAVHTQTELKAGMRAHYHCSVCDTYFDSSKNETTAIALTIPAPTHSFGDWVMDDEKHWKVCSCGLKANEHTHNYTDSADMICNDCSYDRTVPHTHGNGVLQSGQAATCTVNGWKDYYKCSCGNIYADAACTNEITSLEEWKNGDGKIVAEHTYGSLIPKVNATCSQAGMEAHYECSVCHTLFDENKAVKTENELTIAIDGSAHKFGAWTSNGNGTHSRVCGINANHKETVACSGGTATCTEKAICSVCNTAYGEALGHDAQDVWSTDGEYHWHKCTRCEEQLDKAAHADVNNDGKCDTCGYTINVVHTHDYGTAWKSDENNHWNECACGDKANVAPHVDENNDGKCDTCDYAMGTPENPGGEMEPEKTGLSGGAIAGIAVGSVAVVGLGGFSFLWFVIKKKKFADLIALFKKK